MVERPPPAGPSARHLVATSIRVEPRCFRVVPESLHRLDMAIGKAVVASFVVTQGGTAPIWIVARHTVRTLTRLGIAEHPCAGFLRRTGCHAWFLRGIRA